MKKRYGSRRTWGKVVSLTLRRTFQTEVLCRQPFGTCAVLTYLRGCMGPVTRLVTVKETQSFTDLEVKPHPSNASEKSAFGGNASEFTLVRSSRSGGDTPRFLTSLHRRFVLIVLAGPLKHR